MTSGRQAEAIFEEYLQLHGLSFDYEAPAGTYRPDYWIASADDPIAVCEVTALEKTLGPNRSGAFDGPGPVRSKVKKKVRQGRSVAEAGIPYVVVVWSTTWPTDEIIVSSALFGRLQITMPVDPDIGTADRDQTQLQFGRDAALHADQHRNVSAVSIVKQFNPYQRQADDLVRERRREAGVPPGASLEEALPVILATYDELQAAGKYVDGARRPRLVTYHNPHTVNPLPTELFAGPFDEQHGLIGNGGAHYGTIAVGTQVPRLPE